MYKWNRRIVNFLNLIIVIYGAEKKDGMQLGMCRNFSNHLVFQRL